MLTRRVPFHPLLLSAVPALFLFGENAVQQVTFEPLWLPLAQSLAVGLVALLLGSLLLRDWQRGALLASLAVALFFGFGHAWNLLAGGWHVFAIWAGVAVLGTFLAWRGGRWVRPTNRFLTVAAGLLVVLNLLRVGDFAVGAATVEPPTQPPAIDAEMPEQPRDIYYVILDRYANAATLDRVFEYDNSDFLAALEERGFTVAHDAWANYFKTAFSLLSSLNLEHLDGDELRDGFPASFGPLFAGLRDHLAVPQTLTSLGYEYVHIANYWQPTAENVDAHRLLRYEEGSEFSAALWSTTALRLIWPPSAPDDDPETIQLDQDARGHALFGFEALEGSAERPGPTYTFAHLLVPHPPYVFDRDGSMPTGEERAERSSNEEYVRQLEWTNQRVLEAIDRLQDVPPDRQPIIILQADEGPYPPRFAANPGEFDWLQASEGEIAHKYGILNAFYLPDVDDAEVGVTERTSPVNEFRIVFNAYFGTDLPLLPDTVYLSPDYDRMYDFVEFARP